MYSPAEILHGLANPAVIKTIAVMRKKNPGRWDGEREYRFVGEHFRRSLMSQKF